MIVIGVDVHKQSLTAVAVDEAGRMLDGRSVVETAPGHHALCEAVRDHFPERESIARAPFSLTSGKRLLGLI